MHLHCRAVCASFVRLTRTGDKVRRVSKVMKCKESWGVGVDREEKYITFTREAGAGVPFEATHRRIVPETDR